MSESASSTGWWRDAIVYQVYVRSFADGNGDGTGDIAGLRDRLDYLKDLGVDGCGSTRGTRLRFEMAAMTWPTIARSILVSDRLKKSKC